MKRTEHPAGPREGGERVAKKKATKKKKKK